MSKNKTMLRKNELFTERQNAILWFQKNAPLDFDVYGFDWDKPLDRHFWFIKYKNYTKINSKGPVQNKFETVKKYRFSICYENWLNNRGYITEKIFVVGRFSQKKGQFKENLKKLLLCRLMKPRLF